VKVHSKHTYAAAPDAVLEMMTDPDVLTAKYTALGHRDITILEHTVDGGAVSVRSRRNVPMDVPGFAKRFLSPMNSVEQHDRWDPPGKDRSRTGTWQVNAKGVPVNVGGTLRITPGPKKTTVVEIDGEVSSSIPLIGGKLASFIGGDVQRTFAAEEAFNDQHLGRSKR
jgi:hypothetical protein